VNNMKSITNECIICAEPFMSDEQLTKKSSESGYKEFIKDNQRHEIKNCGHSEFHKKCLVKWSKNNKTCPICRQEFDKI